MNVVGVVAQTMVLLLNARNALPITYAPPVKILILPIQNSNAKDVLLESMQLHQQLRFRNAKV